MKKVRVQYERDEDGWWIASVPSVRGCRTQGRTVDEARRRVREALSLFVDEVDTVELYDDVKLPAAAARALKNYSRLKAIAEKENRRVAAAGRKAVSVLQQGVLRLSARDAARLLGMSHQRVHQLARMK